MEEVVVADDLVFRSLRKDRLIIVLGAELSQSLSALPVFRLQNSSHH